MSAAGTPPVEGPETSGASLEQYNNYLQDLGNFGTRYATSNGFYLSVITGLLVILSVTIPSGAAALQAVLWLAVPVFACLVCWIWYRTIRFYRTAFRIKFQILREIEVCGHLFPTFQRERELFGMFGNVGPHGLLNNEEHIPIVLAVPFVAILAYWLMKWMT